MLRLTGQILPLLLVITKLSTVFSQTTPANCLITGVPATKPDPSLINCYRNNPNSCCNSAADNYIKKIYSNILTPSCIRRFPQLEIYMCFACGSDQPLYTNTVSEELYICKSFVQNLWGADINGPTTAFDNCGMFTGWNSTQHVVLPSLYWKNATAFLNEVLPPFFSNYSIVIVDDSANKACFMYGDRRSFWESAFLIFVVVCFAIFAL